MRLSVPHIRRGGRDGRRKQSRTLRAGRQGDLAQAQGTARGRRGRAAARAARRRDAAAAGAGAPFRRPVSRRPPAQPRAIAEGYAACRPRRVGGRTRLRGRRQPRHPREERPAAGRRDHRAARRRLRRAGAVAGRDRAASRRGSGRSLRDSPSVRPRHRGARLACARPRRIAGAAGGRRGLSRGGTGRRRLIGSAGGVSVGPAAGRRIGLGARPAVAAPLFDRLFAEGGARGGSPDGRRGALRKAGQAPRRRRVDLSERPRRSGRGDRRLHSPRAAIPPACRSRRLDRHDRPRHRDRAFPRLPAGAPGDRSRRANSSPARCCATGSSAWRSGLRPG